MKSPFRKCGLNFESKNDQITKRGEISKHFSDHMIKSSFHECGLNFVGKKD